MPVGCGQGLCACVHACLCSCCDSGKNTTLHVDDAQGTQVEAAAGGAGAGGGAQEAGEGKERGKGGRKITMAEVAKHKSRETGAWIVREGKVRWGGALGEDGLSWGAARFQPHAQPGIKTKKSTERRRSRRSDRARARHRDWLVQSSSPVSFHSPSSP